MSVRLDRLQLAWLDAIADEYGCSRAAVLREALKFLSARESDRIARTRRYAVIGMIARAERWDPITDYLGGRKVKAP